MEESTRYLLIGGGLASVWAAQSIREHDAEGRLIIVGLEKHPPYDRPPLSKQSLTDDSFKDDDCYSKQDAFYPENRIDLRLGNPAVAIDRAGQSVLLQNGDTLRYEKLLLATGSTPIPLKIPGHDRPGVHYLRTVDDSAAIRAAFRDARRAVIVGTGYMGMEVISGALERGADTSVIAHSPPWSKFASPRLSQFMAEQYQARGAQFLLQDEPHSIEGEAGALLVTTERGHRLEADCVVACLGVTQNVQLATDAGLEVDPRDGVVVNEFLQSSDPHIWAAGDIACFQDVALGKRWHAEHFLNAQWQGQAVGAIMAGEQKPYDQVPYFFSDFLDLHMVLRGDPAARKDTTLLGDLGRREFVELYPDETGKLRMGVGISPDEKQLDPFSDKLEQLIRAGTSVQDLTAAEFGL